MCIGGDWCVGLVAVSNLQKLNLFCYCMSHTDHHIDFEFRYDLKMFYINTHSVLTFGETKCRTIPLKKYKQKPDTGPSHKRQNHNKLRTVFNRTSTPDVVTVDMACVDSATVPMYIPVRKQGCDETLTQENIHHPHNAKYCGIDRRHTIHRTCKL